ncbi:hypothetical protein [Acetobacterium wieringae]|uniref:hypothetical protein n=1 Tax=Acetobacterium wieringae TaxID=52694 RepID=UPI00315983D7
MEENLSKLTTLIGSMELSPSEFETVLWLSEQETKHVENLCRIMDVLKNYKEETFKKYVTIHKDKYESDVHYFDTLDDANEFAMERWNAVKNEPEHHVYVGLSSSVLMDENGEYYSGSLDLIFPIGAFDSSEPGLYRTTVNFRSFQAI